MVIKTVANEVESEPQDEDWSIFLRLISVYFSVYPDYAHHHAHEKRTTVCVILFIFSTRTSEIDVQTDKQNNTHKQRQQFAERSRYEKYEANDVLYISELLKEFVKYSSGYLIKV